MNIVKYVGSLPEHVREAYEGFMQFDSQEGQIARLYEPRSTYLFVTDRNSIVGTISMIHKRFSFDRLPCEFSYLEQINSEEYSISNPEGVLSLGEQKESLPIIEIAYLKVGASNPLRFRTFTIKVLCDAMESLWRQGNAKTAFLSCDHDANLERLYFRFWKFKKAATIRYGTKYYSLMAKHHPNNIIQPSSYERCYHGAQEEGVPA